MSGEGDSQPVTDPRLVPEVLNMIDEESVGDYWEEEDEWILPARLSETELRELLIERRLSEDDVDFNLKVLRIRNIAFHDSDLVRLVEKEYECGIIMALSLALKEVERCLEEIGQLYGRVSHAQDKDALAELCNLLEWYAGDVYWDDLLREVRRVGAAYSEPHIPYEGRWYGGIDYELIEARFALDAIWDGEAAMMDGASLHNIQLAKTLHPQLDADADVVKARRSLRIPPGGFKDLDAAHKWAKERKADWSRHDEDKYWKEVVWWESFAWDPNAEELIGRGYLMLHLPKMGDAVQRLVEEYDPARGWQRALPFYLIRGRLEPPPKVKKGRPREQERDELLTDLVDEYGYELAQITYNLGLAPEDLANILEQDPTILLGDLHTELHKLADKRKSRLPKKKQVSYDALRQLVNRTRARRATIAEYFQYVTETRP